MYSQKSSTLFSSVLRYLILLDLPKHGSCIEVAVAANCSIMHDHPVLSNVVSSIRTAYIMNFKSTVSSQCHFLSHSYGQNPQESIHGLCEVLLQASSVGQSIIGSKSIGIWSQLVNLRINMIDNLTPYVGSELLDFKAILQICCACGASATHVLLQIRCAPPVFYLNRQQSNLRAEA